MKLRKVDPNRIKVPETRVTARMDEETARQFEESVKTIGIDEPIKVYEVEGELILSDGLHRLQQAIRNKLTSVEVYVRPGTMEDVICNNLQSGHLRGKHPVSEMVKMIEILWKEYKYDSDAIVKKTGLTRDYVEDLMLVSNLTPLCRECLDEGKIKLGHAKELTRVKDPAAQEMYLQQAQLYRWSVKELKGYVDEYLITVALTSGRPPPPATRTPIMLKCAYCGTQHDVSEIANPNTCRECNGIMLGSIAQARREAEAEAQAAARAAVAGKPEKS